MAEESQTGKDINARSAWINQVVAGRYEVLESVGETPWLWIFRVRDQLQNRILTLRLLRGDLPERDAVEQQLNQGWKRALMLQHTGIVRAYDLLEDSERGLCGLTTEFVRGLDLRERIRRAAPFALNVAVEIALGVAESLEYAHTRGMVHGDLNPDRVLLPGDGIPVLTGFGESPDPESTPTDDIQALGAILFWMLTGQLPARQGDGWVSPRHFNQGVPRALEGISLKALGEGYGSASELVTDLNAVKEALRQGGALSWSPLGEPAPATIPVPSTTPVAPPAVMPGTTPVVENRRVSRPTGPHAAAEPPQEEPLNAKPTRRQRPGIGRWFVSFNLLLIVAIGVLAWQLVTMVMKIMIPPGEVVVPDLVGKTVEEAEALGRRAKFEVMEVEKKNQVNFPANTIYMQQEQKGMKVREGQTLHVGISLGPITVTVPSVTEMLLEKAKKELDKSGMRMGQVTYRFDYMSKGNVIEQEPTAGERRAKGSIVNLVVSKGDEPTPEPTIEPTPEPIPEAPPVNDNPPPANPPRNDTPRVHSFSVPKEPYIVPRDGKSHRIRIDVEDEEGKRTEYDAQHEPGESVQASVTVTGKAKIRLYDNDALKGEANI